MKIGILGTRGIPNRYGGFEQVTEYLSVGLVARGHEVYVYNPHHHPWQEKKWNNVNIIHCKDPDILGTAGQFIYDLHCINDSRTRNFDIVLHLGYTSDSIWNFRWPKKSTHLVNMDGLEWKRSKYNGLTRKFLRWAESIAAKKSDGMIADSVGIGEYILSAYKKPATYIPYGADICRAGDPGIPKKYDLEAYRYGLVIARMEPENSIEMIIQGYLNSSRKNPLLVIGNISNKYGSWLLNKYKHPLIKFSEPVYDQNEVNNLRFYSSIYFHGHSVGGTNPSLLEAMGCGCNIAAHDNIFNRAVLGNEAEYFSDRQEVTAILDASTNPSLLEKRKELNIDKIRTIYNKEKIVQQYEKLFLESIRRNKP